jgi:hypothetical protein
MSRSTSNSIKRFVFIIVIAQLTLVTSFLIRFELRVPARYTDLFWNILLINFVVKIFASIMLNNQVINDLTTKHVHFLRIIFIGIGSAVFFFVVNLLHLQNTGFYLIPNSVLLIDLIFFTNILILYRIFYHAIFYEWRRIWNRTHSYGKSMMHVFNYLSSIIYLDKQEDVSAFNQLGK